MPRNQVRIVLQGWEKVYKALLAGEVQTKAAVNDALGEIGLVVAQEARNLFGKGPSTPRWAPLSPATIREKTKAGYGNRGTLIRTGDLRRSVVSSPINPKGLWVKVGSDDPKAAYHTHGTRNMPARPFLEPANNLTKDRQLKILKRHLLKVPILRSR